SLMDQMRTLEDLFPRLGFARPALVSGQEFSFDALSVAVQGSGLRAAFPILAALTDYGLNALLIDEPELSLEPRLQKGIRDLLLEFANKAGVAVVVATHSHLFLDRTCPSSTIKVSRADGYTTIWPLGSDRQLQDVVFELLGNSTEDLFFPRNYLIVEGAS